jgi:hypothetical protein
LQHPPPPHTDHRPHTGTHTHHPPNPHHHITRADCFKPLADNTRKEFGIAVDQQPDFSPFRHFRQVSATFPRFGSKRGVAVENRYCETAVVAALGPPPPPATVTNLPPLRPNHPILPLRPRAAPPPAAVHAPYRTSKACRRAHFLTFHNSCHSLCCCVQPFSSYRAPRPAVSTRNDQLAHP